MLTRFSSHFLAFFAGFGLLLLFGAPDAFAQQGRLQGRVTASSAHRPLAGVSVRIQGTSLGTTTGEDGRYVLEEVPAGRQVVLFSHVGYDRVRKEVVLSGEETQNVDVVLSPSAIEMKPVDVLAQQRSFQSSYETSTTVTRISSETTQAYNTANNYDALRLVPGVSYLHGSGGRYGTPSRIRGGSAWTVPTVIDDFPSIRESGIGAEDGGLKAGLGASIPAVALQGIEVKKGNSGVLYSGGANGGVIVNKLESGQPGPPSGTLWFEINPISEQLYMADIGGGTETVDYYLATKLLNGGYQDLQDTQGRTLKDDHFFSGLARVGYNPQGNMRLELTALRGRDQIQYELPQPDDEETPEVDESTALPPQEFETTNATTFVGTTFEHSLDEFSYEGGYSFFRDKALRYSVTDGEAHRDRPQRTHTVFANGYFGRVLSAGWQYSSKFGTEWVQHGQEEHAGDSDKAHSFTDRSVFYANSFSYNERLFLNGGLRYLSATDDFQDHSLLLYDVGAAYRLPHLATKLHASYSTGYSRNKGFVFFFGPIEEAGGVKLSTSRTAEAGIDQPVTLHEDGLLRMQVTGFYRTDSDVPVFSGWGDGTVYYEERDVRGVELYGMYQFRQLLSLIGSFSYQNTEITSTTHPENLQIGSTAVPVPRYTGGAGVKVRPTGNLRFSLLGTHDAGMRQKQVDVRNGDVTLTENSSYTRINASMGYDVTERLTARLRVENLLDQTDLGYSTETIGPGGSTTTASTAERPGRFVSLAVTFRY